MTRTQPLSGRDGIRATRGDMFERRQPNRSRPGAGNIVLAVRLLQPDRGVKYQNVRSDHGLDQVEDARMAPTRPPRETTDKASPGLRRGA